MASLPPCLPQFTVPHCWARLCCGDSVTSYLCPNSSPCPADTTLASDTLLQTRGCGWEQRGAPWAVETLNLSWGRCSDDIPLHVLSWGDCCHQLLFLGPLVHGESWVAAHSSQETLLLPQSGAQGRLGNGASRCEQMAATASPVTAGPFPRDAPAWSPIAQPRLPCSQPARLPPGRDAEVGRGAGGGSRALLVQPRQNQVGAIIPPQAVAPG